MTQSFLNKGELGEILVIRKLFEYSKINDIFNLVKIFGNDADMGIKVLDIESDKPILNDNSIKKTKSTIKPDCLIQFNKTNTYQYISIKCKHGANPTILNHTPRSAKCFQPGGDLNIYLPNYQLNIKV